MPYLPFWKDIVANLAMIWCFLISCFLRASPFRNDYTYTNFHYPLKKEFYNIISEDADSLFQIDCRGENWRLDLQFLYSTSSCGIDSIFSIS